MLWRCGSSPRVRGTGPRINGAGVQTAVHPRVCGEQTVFNDCGKSKPGSSPRVRGTDRRAVQSCGDPRFIPACAGNRCRNLQPRRRNAVHPRVCGEQGRFPTSPPKADGSSPRVRGTDLIDQVNPTSRRFIPACAGNSRSFMTMTGANSVHPRVCGEQFVLSPFLRSCLGSSPRVRGTVPESNWPIASGRFIPACAGNRARPR